MADIIKEQMMPEVMIITKPPEKDPEPHTYKELIEKFQPKNNCRKCFGRGVAGWLSGTQRLVRCSCLRRRKGVE